MKVQCSQGHVCGEITSDIDTDERIVVRDEVRPPFKLDLGGACVAGSQEKRKPRWWGQLG
jgi:hypothetical protein